MENNKIIKLALDLTHGQVPVEYSSKNPSDVLRAALIDANGGTAVIDRKTMRRNKVAIFEIIEELVPILVKEGLIGDEFYMRYVDERRLAEGDENKFVVDKNTQFIVSKIARGIATPRRQRIGEKSTISVDTTVHAVRMYEEFTRFMAGRIDWNDLVTRVANAFKQQIYNDIYTAFSGITANTVGLNSTYVKSGSYDEETLLGIVDHVEAATGKSAVILGTKVALRKCTTAVVSDTAKDDYYNSGFYGKLAGVPMVYIKNQHAVGTDTFIFPDDVIYVLAADDKFIKVVYVGDSFMKDNTDGTENADMSIEYLYLETFGVAIVMNSRLGKYSLT